MKTVLDLVVKDNKQLNLNYSLLILTPLDNSLLPDMLPGQFVQVQIKEYSTFLRRPISVHFVDKKHNELWLLIQVVGAGTLNMSLLRVNDTINLILPLGNSFSFPNDKNEKILLIGGGVGLAPLLYLGAELRDKDFIPSFLLGARSKSDVLQLAMFEQYGDVFITTEDGSFGEKGYVTNHTLLQKEKYSKIYTCGPNPMMRAVAMYANEYNIDCEVSLENMMACGFGACLCCVEDTKDGNVCVCTEGPVFNIKRLKWID